MSTMLTQRDWARLADRRDFNLLALWADNAQVYALLRAESELLLVSTLVEDDAYPALSPAWPLAAQYERMVHDLWGHVARDGTDPRPMLDHGRWPLTTPAALHPGPPSGAVEPPEFTGADGLDQIPLGPIRGDLEPASHLRIIGRGETIVRLETRLGYTHKGTLNLIRGKSPRAAARFAARLAAEATVAHSIAFAQASESASSCEPPPKALVLRSVMAELERITTHLAAIAAVAEASGLASLSSLCARHEEAMRRAAERAFGHRLMMDCVVPGGVADDITADGVAALSRVLAEISVQLPELKNLPASHWSHVGVVTATQARRFAATGVIGRAGDTAARVQFRLAEIRESVGLLGTLLEDMPDGEMSVPLPSASGEGLGFATGPNGDVWHWLRVEHGQIAGAFMCDPAWAHWCLLEAIMPETAIEDLPLVLASFGLGSSGVDL